VNAIVAVEQPSNAAAYRASTDAAEMCKEIVVATASDIQGKRYVCVEGWQAIAIAHGCTASACGVQRVPGGVKAIGQVRRMSDGAVIAEAEGFVGEDEPTWFGGTVKSWKWGQQRGEKVWYDKELPKRPEYAIRAMAQTRAISRACRSAFAHVVVMMNAGLQTTPAEEIPHGGFDHVPDAEIVNEPVEVKREPVQQKQEAITEAQWTKLTTLLETTSSDVKKFCEVYRCKSVREISPAAYDRAVSRLEQKLAKMTPAKSEPQSAEFEEISDEDLPY